MCVCICVFICVCGVCVCVCYMTFGLKTTDKQDEEHSLKHLDEEGRGKKFSQKPSLVQVPGQQHLHGLIYKLWTLFPPQVRS